LIVARLKFPEVEPKIPMFSGTQMLSREEEHKMFVQGPSDRLAEVFVHLAQIKAVNFSAECATNRPDVEVRNLHGSSAEHRK